MAGAAGVRRRDAVVERLTRGQTGQLAVTATGLVPEPGDDEHGTLDPKDGETPYSKRQSVTFEPFGLTVPATSLRFR